MASNLEDLSPVSVCGETLPHPLLFGNIPMIHDFLEQVLADWLRAVEPYQRQVDRAQKGDQQTIAAATALFELHHTWLKCLFSYAFFFRAADEAYEEFYAGLNKANSSPQLQLGHGKPPKKSSFVKKIVRIRNVSIAHTPSAKELSSSIDAHAAKLWGPGRLGWNSQKVPDLEKITFRSGTLRWRHADGTVEEAQDLEVEGLKATHHDHCLPYLEQFDKMCCDYLKKLQSATKT